MTKFTQLTLALLLAASAVTNADAVGPRGGQSANNKHSGSTEQQPENKVETMLSTLEKNSLSVPFDFDEKTQTYSMNWDYKEGVRNTLNKLKVLGKELTAEQNKRASLIAKRTALYLEESMFGDQKDINPFKAHDMPSDIMGLISRHAEAEDRHALTKAAIVDKQMHGGVQPILALGKAQLKIIDDAMNFFDEALDTHIFGTEDGSVPPKVTREEAQDILQEEIAKNAINAIQFFGENPQILSTISVNYKGYLDYIQAVLLQLDIIATS